MVNAVLFGVIASSPLIVGSALGAWFDPPERLTANLLAFASGALIIALAFDLFERPFSTTGPLVAGGGLLIGAATFTVVDYFLDRRYGEDSSGFGLLASITLDGVPENTALGVVLIGGANPLALLAAIFASNFPEALGGGRSIASRDDKSARYAVGIWTAAAVLLALAVVAGNTLFAGLNQAALAAVRTFAGGAVVASLATEVMPEAYSEGGEAVGFATALGFLFTFFIG